MRYAWLVAWREYSENTKTKGFWISILLLPVILFLSAKVPMWLEKKAIPTRSYVLVDQSGTLAPVIEAAMEKAHQQKVLEALNEYARTYLAPSPGPSGGASAGDCFTEFSQGNPHALQAFVSKGGKAFYLEQLRPRLKPGAPTFEEPRRRFQLAKLPEGVKADAELSSVAESLRPYLCGERKVQAGAQTVDLSAAVLIPRDVDRLTVRPGVVPPGVPSQANSVRTIEYWSINASEFSLRDELERAVNAEVRRREYLARGLDGAIVRQVEQTYAPFATLNPKKEKGREAVDATDTIKQWAPSAFVYLLWISIFIIIQMLLNNTIEEKSNCIIEVLLSSVTPGELMMGKLFGIAAVGLSMIGAWMLALFGILSWQAGSASHLATQLLAILKGSNLLLLFSVYFLLGYFMYAAFILSIGSVCNTIKEAQSYMSVLTMVMMVPLLTMTFIPKDPNGTLARVLSWIPFYTPFTMMNRATADPPLVDLIGTLVLLLASTAGAMWMSGKIFRIGILRTGQPPKVLEMLRWAMRRGE
jgi:ABC-2 type transport system permease protein